MTPTKNIAKSASTPKTGRFATLRGPLHAKGSGAPRVSSRGLLLSLLAAALGALLFAAAPALAEKYSFSTSFGGPSLGVAVNQSTGHVYAANPGTGAVEDFEASGAPDPTTPKLLNAAGTEPFQFGFPFGVAVDNSAQSSKGDVYVVELGQSVDQFDAAGEATGLQITEADITGSDQGDGKFEPVGVAVNSAGEVYVDDLSNSVIDEFSSTGVFITQFGSASQIRNPRLLAIDGANNLYVAAEGGVVEYDGAGNCVGGCVPFDREGGTGVAVDGAGDVFATNEGPQVSEYNASHTLVRQFGGETSQPPFRGLHDAFGVAVDDSTQAVYVADYSGGGAVDMFVIPPVETEPASPVAETGATLRGSIDPKGETLTECYFEYGTEESYGQRVPCESIPTGTSRTPVSAEVSNLDPRTTYHYRLVDNGPKGVVDGFDQTLYTVGWPAVETEPFSNAGSSSVTLTAKVDPGGAPTSYFFEYGPSEAYGSLTPVESAGGGLETVSVASTVEGLQPETAYHFRIVASNSHGTVSGGDRSFSTYPLGVLGLPDGRVYELVSSLENGDATALLGYPARAAADGSAVVYSGTSTPVGGNGVVATHAGGRLTGTNTYLAKRSATGGWTAADIQPPGVDSAGYRSFSSDLSVGILGSEQPLVEGAPTGSEDLYSRNDGDGSYQLLGVKAQERGATPDGSHVLVESESGAGLYDSVGGQLEAVNVLPEGGLASEAAFGSPSGPDLENVISTDGSHIFWTDLATSRLYVRENDTRPQSPLGGNGECTVPADACTVAVSAGIATYWGATPDGRYAFYIENGELWRFDTSTDTREALASKGLEGESAGVEGVLGASEDGSYVYFAAAGALVEGVKAQECIPGNGGTDCNVYVIHGGEAPKFVATVSEADGWGPGGTGSEILVIDAQTAGAYGDWSPNIGDRTAYVAADGHRLVFESVEHLTGFEGGEGREIYTYDFGSGVSCVSCNPTGASTTYTTNDPQEAHSELPQSQNSTYALRDISADGNRVFFETNEKLVSQDTNEEEALPLYTVGLTNVYEWEHEGSDGSCPVKTPARPSGGCIFLLSGGTSTDISFFLDASENGDDVFIETRADLVPQDHGDEWEVYDVRAGAPPEPAPPACTGSGCQGVPGAPPIFATPSSVTFDGVGNFPPPPAPVEKITKKTVKCAKGKKLDHGKCVKQKKPKKSTHRKGSK